MVQTRSYRVGRAGLVPVDYREPVGCEVWLLLKAFKARVMSTDVNAKTLSNTIDNYIGPPRCESLLLVRYQY